MHRGAPFGQAEMDAVKMKTTASRIIVVILDKYLSQFYAGLIHLKLKIEPATSEFI